jgi:hypothetical protein
VSSRREVQLSRDEGELLPELLPNCADHSCLAIPMNRKATRSESSPLQEENWPKINPPADLESCMRTALEGLKACSN